MGWFSLFWVGAALTGLACVTTLFLVPETLYDRGKHSLPVQRALPRPSRYMTLTPPPILSLNTLPSMRLTLPSRFRWSIPDPEPPPIMTFYDDASSEDLTTSSFTNPAAPVPPRTPISRHSKTAPRTTTLRRDSAATTPPSPLIPSAPFTFLQSLKLGTYKGNVLHHFKKPWYTLYLPATWVIMLQYGGLVGGVAVISTVGPQILSLPPYHWGENAGLLFVGALVGILLGALCTGLMADRRLKKLARNQDHGYAEPESRIAVMAPSLAVGTCGLLVFGFCAQYPGKYQWVGLQFAYCMVAFALAQVPSIWFNYVSSPYSLEWIVPDSDGSNPVPAHRLVQPTGERLLRHDLHPPRPDPLCLDVFRVSVGSAGGVSDSIWWIYCSYGCLCVTHSSCHLLGQAHEDCHGSLRREQSVN